MADISYNSSDIYATTGKMKNNVELIVQKLKTLDEKMLELRSSYQSEATEACIMKYDQVKPELEQLPKAVNSVAETIETITRRQFELQSEMATQWK